MKPEVAHITPHFRFGNAVVYAFLPDHIGENIRNGPCGDTWLLALRQPASRAAIRLLALRRLVSRAAKSSVVQLPRFPDCEKFDCVVRDGLPRPS